MSNSLALSTYFNNLNDPRVRKRCDHFMIDIIVIALCAVICRCDNWQQIEAFGQRREDWFRRFLRLPNGIPSHDTFERLFQRLDPLAFQHQFCQWAQAVGKALGLPQVAIDGKTVRGSRNSLGQALHLVSAWATDAHLSLGQVAVDQKSNEITAIPELLALLDVRGALVTIDAMGCQKDIAKTITDAGGDYILTVKDNQPKLLEDIQQCFADAFETNFEHIPYDNYETMESAHGRMERRSYTILTNPTSIRHLDLWENLTVIGMCHSERLVDGKSSSEVRYFIGSREASARVYGEALRNHWGIENNLHWQLDVSFSEDASRIENRNGATNFAMLRRIALSLLKRHPSKRSIATKRLEAALDTEFLEEILRPLVNLGEL